VEWKRSRILVRTKRLRTPLHHSNSSRQMKAAACWRMEIFRVANSGTDRATHRASGSESCSAFGGRTSTSRPPAHCPPIHRKWRVGAQNYRERTIPLTADAIVALVALPRRGELAFTRGNGNALSRGMAKTPSSTPVVEPESSKLAGIPYGTPSPRIWPQPGPHHLHPGATRTRKHHHDNALHAYEPIGAQGRSSQPGEPPPNTALPGFLGNRWATLPNSHCQR